MTVAWLWLYGPPGVGKSATGFELFEQLASRGDRVAFVELDQIGMCMPALGTARSAAKAKNLFGMLANFAAAGADGVIVSGDVVESMTGLLARAPERRVLCRLRADDDVALQRLTIRQGVEYAMPSSVYESYGVPAGDIDITSHPLGVEDVAAEIVRRLGSWPPSSTVTDAAARLAPPAVDGCAAILVTGPRAVGTSAVAWHVLRASVASGCCTGYLDVEQLGFLSPTLQKASLATKLANVATCWSSFRAQGAERLVLCGHVRHDDLDAVRQLVPSLRVVVLTASPATLLERARRRSHHKDIWLPGDDLYGRDDADLREIVRRAETSEHEHADLVVDTDSLTPPDMAAHIAPLWPGATT